MSKHDSLVDHDTAECSIRRDEHHTRDTARVAAQVSDAAQAIHALKEMDLNKEQLQHLATIELAMKIVEHKVLRITEMETEIARLKARKNSLGLSEADFTELQQKLDRANHTIKLLEELNGSVDIDAFEHTGS